MSENAALADAIVTPRIEYARVGTKKQRRDRHLHDQLIGAVVFGGPENGQHDPRCVRVGLKPLRGGDLMEIWRANGDVRMGLDDVVRYAADTHYLAGAIELDERRYGGIAPAAEAAYAALRRFVAESAYPHLLRVWNYFDGINTGAGDAERYRLFCAGRAAGYGVLPGGGYAAATAIGRRDGDPTLQVYWLAGRVPGVPLENPRQTSAYRYPREYGPTSPSFSRAMLVSQRLVLVSGTASIVGHASHHPGDLQAQLDETLANLSSVIQRASSTAPLIPPRLGKGSMLKFYLREAAEASRLDSLLRRRLPAETPYMILEADICRSELLLEVDCLHGV